MTTEFEKTLKYKARYWAGEITKLAKSFAPNHLQKGISSHVEDRSSGEYVIRTTATGKDARAWEYGSGLHAKRGVKKKYPIVPKSGNKLLAFRWDVANANPDRFNFLPDGRVLLPSVQHPGIEAANGGKGYIAPAQIEIRKRIKQDLKNDIPNAIRADLRKAFERK